MRSMLRHVAVGALVLGGSLAFTATPAHAAASCSLHVGASSVSVQCTDAASSRQYYRAVAVCSNGDVLRGPSYLVNSGVLSVATCRYGSRAVGGGPEVG